MKKLFYIIFIFLIQSLPLHSQSPGWVNFGPMGLQGFGNGRVYGIDFPSDPNSNSLYVAGEGGAWKSTDGGNSWTLLTSQIRPSSHIGSILVDKNNVNNLFISTGNPYVAFGNGNGPQYPFASFNTTGIYRSMDGGQTWTAINSGLPSIMSPQTFTNSPNSIVRYPGTFIYKLVACPWSSNQMFALTSMGLYQTSTALSATPTWTKITTPWTNTGTGVFYPEAYDLVFMPGSSLFHYTGFLIAEEGMVSSTSFVTNPSGGWTFMTGSGAGQINVLAEPEMSEFSNINNRIYELDILSSNTNVRYISVAIGGNATPPGLPYSGYVYKFVYKYNGSSWVKGDVRKDQDDMEGSAIRNDIVIDPLQSTRFFSGGGHVLMYDDSKPVNQKWVQIGYTYSPPSFHGDSRCIKISKFNNSQFLYSGNDGGVGKIDLRTSNILNWSVSQEINNTNLSNGFVIGLTSYENDPSFMYVSLMDDGEVKFKNNGSSQEDGGDGHEFLILDEYKYLQKRADWCKPPSYFIKNQSGHFIFSQILDPLPTGETQCTDVSTSLYNTFIKNETSIYWVGRNIHKYKNSATNDALNYMGAMSDFGSLGATNMNSKQVYGLSIYRNDPNIAYAILAPWSAAPPNCLGCTDFFYTNNLNGSNVTWTKRTLPSDLINTDKYLTGVAVSSVDPNSVFICSNFTVNNKKVMVSRDAGVTWNDYNNSVSIPYEVLSIAYEPGSNDGVYVGTASGLYYTNKNMTNWVEYSNGLVKGAPIKKIEMSEIANKITIGTWGSGVWQCYLYCDAATNLTLSGTITSSLPYDTKGWIQSTSIIDNSPPVVNVTYRAGTYVQLLPGFNAKQNSNFRAYTQPCGGPAIVKPARMAAGVEPIVDNESEEDEDAIERNTEKNIISAYPNPSIGMFELSIDSDSKSSPEIKIFDTQGKEVKYQIDEITNGKLYKINMYGNVEGMYIIKVIVNSREYLTKVLITGGTTMPKYDNKK